MKTKILKTSLAIAISATSCQSFASGFALNEQSIAGMGMSFAGRSSSAEDASTVFGNPAGMARLKQEQINVGAAAIIASTDISDASGTTSGSNDGDMVPITAIPMGYYVKPLDDKVAFGFAIYVPFGLSTDYESGFQGRYHGDKSYVSVITLQPTLSYRFNDQLSIGFGPTINRIDGELTSASANPYGGGDGKVKIKGDDTAIGFNVGLLYEFSPHTRAGLTYHSKVKYELEGDNKANLTGVLAGYGGKFDASLEVTTPESVDFSITHQLNANWTLYAGSTWTRWSRLKELRVESQGAALSSLSTIVEELNWHDTWAHAIGLSYQLNPRWVLRSGIAIDASPTNNVDRSPRIPSGDRTVFSMGASWTPKDAITIDLAYSYLKEEDVTIRRDDYSSTYKNSAHGLGTSLTYRF